MALGGKGGFFYSLCRTISVLNVEGVRLFQFQAKDYDQWLCFTSSTFAFDPTLCVLDLSMHIYSCLRTDYLLRNSLFHQLSQMHNSIYILSTSILGVWRRHCQAFDFTQSILVLLQGLKEFLWPFSSPVKPKLSWLLLAAKLCSTAEYGN